jgi:hypothetical protein
MIGEFLVGGTEAAHHAGLVGEFGFVDHGTGIAGAAGGLNRWSWGWNVMLLLTFFSKLNSH